MPQTWHLHSSLEFLMAPLSGRRLAMSYWQVGCSVLTPVPQEGEADLAHLEYLFIIAGVESCPSQSPCKVFSHLSKYHVCLQPFLSLVSMQVVDGSILIVEFKRNLLALFGSDLCFPLRIQVPMIPSYLVQLLPWTAGTRWANIPPHPGAQVENDSSLQQHPLVWL